MDAAINVKYLRFDESSDLYNRICSHAGSEVAGFIFITLAAQN